MIEEVRLVDLITLQRGFDISKKEQVNGPIPVISSGGISSYHNKYKVNGPGVIIGRKGTLGSVFYTEKDYWPHSTGLWVKEFNGNDPKFIYYYLQILHFERFDSGAANPTLNRNHIHSLKVNVPVEKYRPLIASVLSAYDDLIENNNQRIHLLEEMASEIYKEWFVRLRFPGYENAFFRDKNGKEVDRESDGAFPDGWNLRQINDIVSLISGYAFKSKHFDENGRYGLVTIKNVQNGFFITETTDKVAELPQNMKDEIHIKEKDILLSLTGNIGRICLAYGNGYLLNQRVAKIKPIKDEFFEFSYMFFRSDFLRKTLENYSNGAAQQNLSPIDTGLLEFNFPTDDLIEEYSKLTKAFFDEIIVLLNKNQVLQETRDLLLPRLISGKLSVEQLLNETYEPKEAVRTATEPAAVYETKSIK